MQVFNIETSQNNSIYSLRDFHEAYNGRDWRFYRVLLSKCIRYGEPGKILDLGAGLGLFVECCMNYGIECIGIEGSEWACKTAIERCGADILCLDLAEKFPIKDEEFSVVVCNQTMEHVSPTAANNMLQESYRVLRPNGLLIIDSPGYYNSEERKEEKHINLYTPSRLRKEVEAVGFKILMEDNSPRLLFGSNRLGSMIMKIIFRVVKYDFLSDTANCMAFKEF